MVRDHAGWFLSPCGVMGHLWALIIPPCRRSIYTLSFYPPTLNSSIIMSDSTNTSDFFSNTESSEISGGEYLAARDSPATFFKNGKRLKITGGKYGTVDRTDTSQSSTPNATRSSTEGHDGNSYPARHRQSTRQSEVNQGVWRSSIMISLDWI